MALRPTTPPSGLRNSVKPSNVAPPTPQPLARPAAPAPSRPQPLRPTGKPVGHPMKAEIDDEGEVRHTPTKPERLEMPRQATTGWGTFEEVTTSSGNSNFSKFGFFNVKDGDGPARVQFLHDEPFVVHMHKYQLDGRPYPSDHVCQLDDVNLDTGSCFMCNAGSKSYPKAAFFLLDFRGEWDKEKDEFANDGKPVARVWTMSKAAAKSLKDFQVNECGGKLTDFLVEISALGEKTDKTWKFKASGVEEFDPVTRRKQVQYYGTYSMGDLEDQFGITEEDLPTAATAFVAPDEEYMLSKKARQVETSFPKKGKK